MVNFPPDNFMDFIVYEPAGLILTGLAIVAANFFMFATLMRKDRYLKFAGVKSLILFERLAFIVAVTAPLLAFLIWLIQDR